MEIKCLVPPPCCLYYSRRLVPSVETLSSVLLLLFRSFSLFDLFAPTSLSFSLRKAFCLSFSPRALLLLSLSPMLLLSSRSSRLPFFSLGPWLPRSALLLSGLDRNRGEAAGLIDSCRRRRHSWMACLSLCAKMTTLFNASNTSCTHSQLGMDQYIIIYNN